MMKTSVKVIFAKKVWSMAALPYFIFVSIPLAIFNTNRTIKNGKNFSAWAFSQIARLVIATAASVISPISSNFAPSSDNELVFFGDSAVYEIGKACYRKDYNISNLIVKKKNNDNAKIILLSDIMLAKCFMNMFSPYR